MVSPFALNLKSNTKEAGNTDTFSPSFKIVLLVNSASVGSEFIRITSGGYLFYIFRVLNRSTFICKSWLALDSVNGKLERRFRAATRDQKEKFPYHYSRAVHNAVTDSHIWLSVVFRPERSTFTRAQRLSCCLATLFLTMVVSAMFYGTEDNVERPNVLRIGPFSFSVHTLWVSAVSLLITVPPMLLIVQLFR